MMRWRHRPGPVNNSEDKTLLHLSRQENIQTWADRLMRSERYFGAVSRGIHQPGINALMHRVRLGLVLCRVE